MSGYVDTLRSLAGRLEKQKSRVLDRVGAREKVWALSERLEEQATGLLTRYGVPVERFRELVDRLDETAIQLTSRYGALLLRLSLGLTFVWFGALKVIESSPVGDLVANTVYWFRPEVFVPLLGYWEIVVGLGLLTGKALRTTLVFFLLQMAGTFLVLVIKPDVAFQDGNPLLLTTEGEFVIKNLILISGGLVVGSTIETRRQRREKLLGVLDEQSSEDLSLAAA